MKREQITEILAEAGVEVSKAVVTNLMNTINEEIRNVRVESANKALDDFKEWYSPEEYKKLQDELAGIKDTSAKKDRVAKYKALNINVDDEDILNLIDSKFKESQNLDNELAEYIKSHPSFLTQQVKQPEQKKEQQPDRYEFNANKGGGGAKKEDAPATLADAFKEEYKAKGQA